eukprot:2006508-Pyramimonas_sp.AAC.1
MAKEVGRVVSSLSVQRCGDDVWISHLSSRICDVRADPQPVVKRVSPATKKTCITDVVSTHDGAIRRPDRAARKSTDKAF